MSSGLSFKWTKHPAALGQAAEDYTGAITQDVRTMVTDRARWAQNEMRATRPWNDMTGNARKGLFASASFGASHAEITFVHTVDYGVYLELSRGGKYAVVVPTMYRTVEELRKDLKELGKK